jgi:diguanylate cyclase (GGDEF)-like protein
MRRFRPARYLAEVALLLVIYVVAGKLGLRLAFLHASATAVWAPTGIALAALVLRGRRYWPAVLLGAFAVNVTTAGSVATSLAIAVGNTLEAVVGASLVNRYARGRHAFERSPDIFRFAALAALGSTTLSATCGVTSLLVGGYLDPPRYAAVWLTWWLGNAVGDLIVAPLLFVWYMNPRLRWSGRQGLEAAGVGVAIVLTGLLVFGGVLPSGLRHYPLNFLCLPVLLWPTFRLGQREAATAAFLLEALAISGTLRGFGPFVRDSPNEALLLLQTFVGVVALTVVAVGAVVAERRRLESRLLHQADHDALTGLLTRRRLQDELSHQLAQASRYGTRGAVLFLDLDDFKAVNDAYGHRAGDQVLAELARRLRGRLRTSDVVARVGGDEFAILLPHTDGVRAQALAAHLLTALRSHSIDLEGRSIAISATIGMALFPDHGASVDELLARADHAMYEAKRMGGSQWRVYSPDEGWRQAIEVSFGGEQDLREALDAGRFVLHGQPILDLRRNRIGQYELLLRMVGDKGDFLPPRAFLGAAERSGRLQTIERWVVRQAIDLLARDGDGRHEYPLSVNVSGKALSDRELLPLIEQELGAKQVDPARLVIEFAESAALADMDQAREFAFAAKGLGCRLALDDFGIGFSSLQHLKDLPVDYLKIDGAFVRDMFHNPVDQHLVRAMVEVARALDKKTIAEFVGDEQTLQLVRAGGLDYAQGYHVGRPRALNEIWPDASAA